MCRCVFACGFGHHLNEELPAREVAGLDRVEQVAAVAFAILGDEGLGLRVGEVCDSLLGAEVEFDPDTFIGGIDHREGMAAEKVHVAEALRDAAVGHDDGDLMQRLRQQRPEIPIVVRAAQPGARVALDRMVEVRKPQRIAEEEDRRVVADDVPVALLGIELEGGAANVAFCVGRAALTGDGREARRTWASACRSPRRSSPWCSG